MPETLHAKPGTRSPPPKTLDAKPETRILEPTRDTEPWILKPDPGIRNPEPENA